MPTTTKEYLLIGFFSLIIIASGLDVYADLSHGADTSHIFKEAFLIAVSIAGLIWLYLNHQLQQKKIHQLHQELQQLSEKKADDYIIEGRRQLGKIIQQQFTQWQLSQSEQEVGMLLLKGLSLKEIAALRNTAEKTVRQQASSIYRKSGLSGRHSFSAWFIEDIL